MKKISTLAVALITMGSLVTPAQGRCSTYKYVAFWVLQN